MAEANASSAALVPRNKVVILDAGAYYRKLIDQKVRELMIETDVLPLETKATRIFESGYEAVIIAGGPFAYSPGHDSDIFKLRIPVLGICHGMELINKEFGGSAKYGKYLEEGPHFIEIEPSSPLFTHLCPLQSVLLTRCQCVAKVGVNLQVIARSGDSTVTGVQNDGLRIYGVQFHPEVHHTHNGKQILVNFLYDICGLKPNFTLSIRKDECLSYISEKVRDNKVLVMVSGGVTSAVCVALLATAVQPSQIIALHIDTGLLRSNETDDVKQWLQGLGIDLVCRNAANQFLNSFARRTSMTIDPPTLCQVLEPAAKRSIIGDQFNRFSNDIIAELKTTVGRIVLTLNTLRSTIIKSPEIVELTTAENNSNHRLEAEWLQDMSEAECIVEPLIDFYKTELKELGLTLGVPRSLIDKHPFPGAGLSVRILCTDSPYINSDFSETQTMTRIIVDYDRKVKNNHAWAFRISIATSEDEQKRLIEISQANIYATLLPVRALGIRNNVRTFSYVVGLSSDSPPNWEDIAFLAKLITRIQRNINRVCYIFGKPVKDMITDITPTTIAKYPLMQLRMADGIANKILKEAGVENSMTKMPVVLLPVHFDRDPAEDLTSCCRAVVLRPFIKDVFMLGKPLIPGTDQMPEVVINRMAKEILHVDGISRVLYDITFSPPGTAEWE